MPKFYGTFGAKFQPSGNFVVIDAKNKDSARDMIHEAYPGKWGFMYSEREFKELKIKFNLTEIPFGVK